MDKMSMERLGVTYSKYFSAFLADEEQQRPGSRGSSITRESTASSTRSSVFSNRPSARPPTTPGNGILPPPPNANGVHTRASPSQSMRKTRASTAEEIPVLEARKNSTFYSDGDDDSEEEEDEEVDDDDDDEEDEDDDEDDDDDEDGQVDNVLPLPGMTTSMENVPVLQSLEDAKAKDGRKKKKKKSGRDDGRSTLRKLRDAARRSPKRPRQGANGEILERQNSQPTISSSLNELLIYGRSSISGNSATVRQMVRSGWLFRKGQHLKTWKRRYFVLLKRTKVSTGEYTASLQYYKGSNFGKIRGEIDLHEAPLTIRFVDSNESKKPFCFEISRGDFALLCQGKDDEDVSAWVCHLQALTAREDSGSAVAAATRFSMATTGSFRRVQSIPTVMDNRAIFIVAELRKLLHNSKSAEATKCKSFTKGFECRNPGSLRQLRDLHATVTDSIMRTHGTRIIGMAEEKLKSDPLSLPQPPLTLDDLRAITSRHVEEVLYVSSEEAIMTFLRRAYGEDDSVVSRKLRWLQGKDQTYFNIPLEHVSWKEWRKASKILSQAAGAQLPTAKYEIILAALKEIRATYAEEHNKQLDAEPLETDDLIPIFTFVLANSGLDNLISLRLLLSELNGAWAVGGSLDDGTALSIFKYAVDFIANVSIPAVLEDIFKDQITLSIEGEWRHVLELEVEQTYRYGAVIRQISQHGQSTIGNSIGRGHVLVTVNGQNVVLWPYPAIATLLKESSSPHRLAFIPGSSYFKILTSTKALWNVALVHACQRGDISSVQMLLANGADVNYVALESGGNTPLHIAVSAQHFNVVSYILQHGAKARTLGEFGRSALHMVGSPCMMPSSSIPVAAHVGNSLRQSMMEQFRPADKLVMIIKKLLNHGASMETTDIYGNTPLLLLAEKGCVQGIDVLIESNGGLDLNARNWHLGMSALALAAREGRRDVVEALLDYGVQPDMPNLRGDTPLHFAAAIGSKEICELLIQRGCAVDVRNRDGLTPLVAAVTRGFDFIERESGSKRRSTTSARPRTETDDVKVFSTIDCLLEAGAKLYAVCKRYRLPLHYAAMHGGQDVFEFVSKKMAQESDVDMRDIYGRSAACIAEARKTGKGLSQDEGAGEEEADETTAGEIQKYMNGDVRLSTMGMHAEPDLITQDRSGRREIVAGSLGAICTFLFDCDSYRLDDVSAFVTSCDITSFEAITEHLLAKLKAEIESPKGVYVRRMALHVLDMMVQSLLQKVKLDAEACRCIYECSMEVIALRSGEDTPSDEWLSSSLLSAFIEAAQSKRMYDLRLISSCEGAYTSLRNFLRVAKQSSTELKFLDDELFASTFGMEAISDTMRRRLSVAGVWTGEAPRSFYVRSNSTPSPSPTTTNRKTLSGMPLPRHKGSVLDRAPRLWVLDVDVSAIAEQITLFQHYLFSQIRANELLTSKKSAETTPAYDRLRQLHNHISRWVVNQILSRDDVDDRAQILAHFIKVAAVCLQPLQNFDGFMAIMNATNDSSVFRLKQTWGRLPAQIRDEWHDLNKFTENGARALNKPMRDATPPMIPYLGVVLQNVIAIQEFPDRVEGDLINFKKIRVLGALMRKFQSMQTSPYLLPTDKRVLEHICASLEYTNAETCFDRSLKVEPRVPTTGTTS
ncbi:hypothetical protein Poli38472_008270 [Pythium oligandrum]|uniref:Uncharacterized protein n=1 Tax=Pythium oligandrum TaxID=41045 RepID=A0A8K1CMH8_PYTOL|nr:hypothetical protein Poli38472_008270 [Pythium oligandrum]|eukprot:TMW65628.1 hypothetical protein Poli38472_008270 [Pythium oligandrum]